MSMTNNESRSDDYRQGQGKQGGGSRPQRQPKRQAPPQQQEPPRQDPPQQQEPAPRQDAPQQNPPQQPARRKHGLAPIRKGSSNTMLVVVILVAVAAVVLLALLFLPGACSRMQGDNGEINVTNTEGSLLSEEQLIDRAKDRYAGTWVISSVTWQGEEGDSNSIPQKVIVNVDGTCTITQGGKEYNGKWEIDGDSLYVTASADGEDLVKVLTIDDANLNINANNGTGTYVRTSKPKIEEKSEE